MAFRTTLPLVSSTRRPFSTLIKANLAEFVPQHEKATQEEVQQLEQLLGKRGKALVLTGAGISTESGLPDYRSAKVGLYAKSNHKPIQYQEFVSSLKRRKQYWARNYFGWQKFSSIQPNIAHITLSEWQKRENVDWIVTQNVDRLHQKAGSERVEELHGNGFVVKCLNKDCDYSISREQFQSLLIHLNSHLKSDPVFERQTLRPDGDIDLESDLIDSFQVPSCPCCGNLLKPDIVFFGDNVRKERVDFVYNKVEECSTLLVVGSSLQVYSGFRFLLRALEKGKKVAIVSIGATRGDQLEGVLLIKRRAGDILPQIKFK